ncbi:vWA domain-containing protein [Roseicyclus mahoneyensis]|uniref:Putative metal-dependent peptidase n=1 Tax=Roseicyclus mahoneyensis TaxID=164332 RepID=A0A316GJ05_9RHOB|nr:VWA-like domain-containing protein [Roseicyclus mahoneyensis]PWK60575.1 putative metal-dependent peptidase [Roseicyclus mahoneyensis]
MSHHSARATRALAHLGEVDPALAVLALWCRHRDGEGATRTDGDMISYGSGFDTLGLPEQVGLVAHHVLHVALRHSDRQAGLAERLGEGFDASLFGLAADGIINEVLILAGHAVPRPSVTLTDLLVEAGMPAKSAVEALESWDADRLAMALHADPKRAERLRDWGATRGFAVDLGLGEPDKTGETQKAADWRNQILRALEAGRKAGSGIGKLGAILADLAPAQVPWEVQLRGLMARALTERPRRSWRRPSGAWVAGMAEAERSGGPVPVYEPGRARMDTRPRLVVALDTSSSIDAQMLRLFTAEAEGIARRTGAEVHLFGFDEAVFVEKRIDPLGWQGMRDLPLRTGGGTDYVDLFEKAGKKAPSMLVVLTDLDAPLPPAPGFAVLWAVPRAVASPPYGRLLVIGQG